MLVDDIFFIKFLKDFLTFSSLYSEGTKISSSSSLMTSNPSLAIISSFKDFQFLGW